MLSQGYLQPARQTRPEETSASAAQSAALAVQEQQVLAEERALTTAANPVSTTYHYTVGPDGRRYITGAEVVVSGDEETIDSIPGGVKYESIKPVSPLQAKNNPNDPEKASQKTEEDAESAGKTSLKDTKATKDTEETENEAREDAIVSKMKQTEREVIAHEAAHRAAGGRFAGPASYSYSQGPDGKKYITGGEVPISVPGGGTPEETARNMEQVARAALAPADPSGQDMRVAAQASAAAAQARQQMAAERSSDAQAQGGNEKDSQAGGLKTGASSVQAGMRFEQIRSGEEPQNTSQTTEPDEAREAYSRAASKNGMWALGRGFEPNTGKKEDEHLDIAA
jgi:hypothetical protein